MNSHLLTHDTAPEYLAGMTKVAALVAEHLAAANPSTGAGVADLAPGVTGVDLDRPAPDLDAALGEVTDLYLRDAIWFHHPSYLAHLNCPVALPAVLAEGFLAAVNTSVDTWDQSAGGTLIERRLIDWTAGRIGFGRGADGVFTSGGTQSNLEALVLARGEALAGTAPEEAADRQARLRVLTTSHSHFSVATAARTMGLPADAVVEVATDGGGRMRPEALREALREVRERGGQPMAVAATAGTTDLGAVDPLRELAQVCAEEGVWLHVDAAYGGGLLASRRRRGLLAGIEHADSVTIDFHKTWFQPVSSSAIIVRDGATLRHVTHHADYLNPRTSPTPNQVDKSLQTTRRFDALKLWLTLRVTGADAVGEMFDEVIDRAREVWEVLTADERFEVAVRPTLSTVLLRYRSPGMPAAEADSLNPRIRRALLDRGDVMVAETVQGGRPWLKLTLLDPETSLEHLLGVLEVLAATGEELSPAPPFETVAGRPPQGAGDVMMAGVGR